MSSPASLRFDSHSVEDTERLAAALAQHLPVQAPPFIVHLQGELGAGKTVFARAVLRALGVAGAIKSPTYTLIEPYKAGDRTCLHVDLYRLRDPSEVEALALRDYLEVGSVWLVEWPERAIAEIPPADLRVGFDFDVQHRVMLVQAISVAGDATVAALKACGVGNKD